MKTFTNKKIEEDSAFGPGMMFGVPGPGPSKDTKGIPSDKKKEKGKESIKSFRKFENFLEEERELNEIGDSSAKPFKWSTSMNVRKWLVDNALQAKDKEHSGPWEARYHKTENPFRYEFSSDTTGTKYHVHIGGFFGKNLWINFGAPKPKDWKSYHCILGLGFGVDGVENDPETNLGEQFRVMSTVVECGLDFIQKVLDDDDLVGIQEFHMKPKLDKEGQKGVDSRRGKLYLAYIKNSFKRLKTGKDYYIEQNNEGFVLKFGKVKVANTGKIPDFVLASTYESTIQKTNTEMKKYIPSFNDYLVEQTLKDASVEVPKSDMSRQMIFTAIEKHIGKPMGEIEEMDSIEDFEGEKVTNFSTATEGIFVLTCGRSAGFPVCMLKDELNDKVKYYK